MASLMGKCAKVRLHAAPGINRRPVCCNKVLQFLATKRSAIVYRRKHKYYLIVDQRGTYGTTARRNRLKRGGNASVIANSVIDISRMHIVLNMCAQNEFNLKFKTKMCLLPGTTTRCALRMSLQRQPAVRGRQQEGRSVQWVTLPHGVRILTTKNADINNNNTRAAAAATAAAEQKE